MLEHTLDKKAFLFEQQPRLWHSTELDVSAPLDKLLSVKKKIIIVIQIRFVGAYL